jgi:16S rRNA (adenine1518-N6/adenine1519-N6)-dimethyltransferase
MPTLYQEVRVALRNSEFKPSKRFGQNFLIHESVIDAILRLLGLSPQDSVLEIGPGLGFLTRRLVQTAATVWAVEIDPVLAAHLRESELGSHPAFRLIHGDVLKTSWPDMLPGHKIKLVGNLPYSISTAVLFHIFEHHKHFSSLVLMVQKEVAARMMSAPGTKAYGTLSVWCRIYGRIVEQVPVSPEAFFPRPTVRSTILKIDLYDAPRVTLDDKPLLRVLVRAAFAQRRKTLGNALAIWLKRNRADVDKFLEAQAIDPKRRGETLSVDDFIRLTGAIKGWIDPTAHVSSDA